MEYKKYACVSMLAVALLMIAGCQYESCKRMEKQEIREQEQQVEAPEVAQEETDMPKENKKNVAKPKKAKKSSGVIEVKNKKEFDAILEEGRPVILKIYSPVCGPCVASKPIFEKLSHKYPDINFVAANDSISQNRAISDQYGVPSYPTFIFIDASGKVVSQDIGFDEENFENNIADFAQKTVRP